MLDYLPIVDLFAHVHRDLWQYFLSNEEWQAIELVANWLKSFHVVTTQMSATHTPMLSTTHAIFCGLQDDIHDILSNLPDIVLPSLKKGLMDAHLKLSDYYYKIDASPFYLWSSHKSYIQFILIIYNLLMNILVLDPHISYDALKDKFGDDFTMLNQLEDSKTKLQAHFNAKYISSPISSGSAWLSSTPSSSMLSVTSDSTHTILQINSSPQKNYTARFQQKHAAVNELSKFWNLEQEGFENCNHVQWWHGQCAQFPNLYCLVHDVTTLKE